jgi:TatD DNase family protein
VHVAHKIAELKGLSVEEIAEASTANFYKLFNKIKKKPQVEI